MATIRIQFKVKSAKRNENNRNEVDIELDDVKTGTNNNTNDGSVKFARIQREDDHKALKGLSDSCSSVVSAGNFRWSSSNSKYPRSAADDSNIGCWGSCLLLSSEKG